MRLRGFTVGILALLVGACSASDRSAADPRGRILRLVDPGHHLIRKLDELTRLEPADFAQDSLASSYVSWMQALEQKALQSPAAESERLRGQIHAIEKLERKRREEWDDFAKSVRADSRIFHGVGSIPADSHGPGINSYRNAPLEFYAVVTDAKVRFYWAKGPYNVRD